MGHAGGLGRGGEVSGLDVLFFRRKVLPEVRDAVGAIGAGKGIGQARLVIEVGLDHLHPEASQCLGLFGARVAGNGPGPKPAPGVSEDGLDQPAPLGAGGAGHGDDLGSSTVHGFLRSCGWATAPGCPEYGTLLGYM